MPQWLQDLFEQIGEQDISLDGAALLATLYPLGIIFNVLEVRALAKVPRVRGRFGIHSRGSARVIAALSIPALMVLPGLVASVVDEREPVGWFASASLLAGTLLSTAAVYLVIELVFMARSLDTATPVENGGATSASSSKAVRPPGTGPRKPKRRKRR